MALTWAFGKRCFSFGKKFKEAIFERYISSSVLADLTRNIVTQTFSEQTTLQNTTLKENTAKPLKDHFEKWHIRGFVEKERLRSWGGIPKNRFSFGLCVSQMEASSVYFGETPCSLEKMSLAQKSAFVREAEKMFPKKPVYKPLAEEECRELRVKTVLFRSQQKSEPAGYDNAEGLSGLALAARVLHQIHDRTPKNYVPNSSVANLQ